MLRRRKKNIAFLLVAVLFSFSACKVLGTVGSTASPVTVVSGPLLVPLKIVKIVAGDNHNCALYNDGTVKCWGANGAQQLDSGDLVDHALPVATVGLGFVVDLFSGGTSSCAKISDGTVSCWGQGTLPTTVNLTHAGGLALGDSHSCSLVNNGYVGGTLQFGIECWGANLSGQLGDGTLFSSALPVPVLTYPAGQSALQISAGLRHSCAVNANGTVNCWGDNSSNELGNLLASPQNTPVAAGTITASTLTAGKDFTCAVSGTDVYCWGDNSQFQLGAAAPASLSTPTQVTGVSASQVAAAANGQHVCAQTMTSVTVCLLPTGSCSGGAGTTTYLAADGGVACWGSNSSGQLGTGSVALKVAAPTAVSGLPLTVSAGPPVTTDPVLQIATGQAHSCALLKSGTVQCWGSNLSGQLGTNGVPAVSSNVPVTVSGL